MNSTDGVSSPYLDNYFCLIPGSNLAFVMISKNAVTFLKRVALYGGTGEWCTDLATTHNLIGFTPTSPYLVPVADMSAWEGENGRRVKFAVYRDPVRRIESSYTLFCLDRIYVKHIDMAGLYRDPSEQHFREFLRFEMSKDPAWVEEHFRRQTDYYSMQDVDVVIDICDVQPFLAGHGVSFLSERSNASEHFYRIGDSGFLGEIENYYEQDRAISVTPVQEALVRTKELDDNAVTP